MARRLIVEIIGDSRSYERALKRSQAAGNQFSASVGGGLVKGAAAFTGITSATLLATSAIRASAQEFAEHARVTAQTEAALKSTGGVANVTAQDISRLADEVLRYSGIDDEAVQSAENLLLTFKNVRNEVGQGNAVFDRATKAAVDLSVAGFGSLDSTAKQLGKALNDPVRGMTALGRAGVTFTQAQKDTIRALVESGQQLEAQKLILAEVESQVGGSARAFGETLPGKIAKAQNSLANLGGELAEKFAPAVEAAAEQVIVLVDAIDRLKSGADRVPGRGILNRVIGEAPDWFKLVGPLGPAAFLFKPPVEPTLNFAKAWDAVGDAIKGAARNLDPFRQAFADITAAFSAAGQKFGPTSIDLPETTLPFDIRMMQAQGADVAAARAIAQFIAPVIASLTAIIESGQLHGKRLAAARKRLLEATAIQTAAQETIAAAQKEASDKQKQAAKKHADAVKAAAEKQRQAAEEAAAKLREATDQARTEIGILFQGPILAPTDAMRKANLGVPGPEGLTLVRDIVAQNQQALRLERDLARLGRLGVGPATIGELRGLGTAAIPQIESLLALRGPDRTAAIRALRAREATARRIGQMIVQTPVVNVNAARVVVGRGGGARWHSRSGRFAGGAAAEVA